MRKLLLLFMGYFILALPLYAQAMPFTFSGMDEGGIGSATAEFKNLGTNIWTVEIENTSPLTLISSLDPNASAINGFGFDFLGASSITGWNLEAKDINNNLIDIGGSGPSTGNWSLNTPGSIGSIDLDFFIRTSGGGPQGEIKGSLYNPDWIPSGGPPTGAAPQYYTLATLEITFNAAANLDLSNDQPFVRMRNVGRGGEGSLKLFSVQEPATMLLLGSGLVGFAVIGRRKFFKKG